MLIAVFVWNDCMAWRIPWMKCAALWGVTHMETSRILLTWGCVKFLGGVGILARAYGCWRKVRVA